MSELRIVAKSIRGAKYKLTPCESGSVLGAALHMHARLHTYLHNHKHPHACVASEGNSDYNTLLLRYMQ